MTELKINTTSCCFITGIDTEGHDLECPHPAIAQCADLNCGDPICSGHGEQCEGCQEWFCMDAHMMLHKCGAEKKGPQPSKHFLPRKVTA